MMSQLSIDFHKRKIPQTRERFYQLMFTAKVQYALILLKELKALKSNGDVGPVKLRDVADKHGMKLEFLEQVARNLRISGYVSTVKGPGGGIVIGKPPKNFFSIYKSVHPAPELKLAANGEAASSYIGKLHQEFLDLVNGLEL